LMYKAVFELSADRGEFVSRLFSFERRAGIGTQSSVGEIIAAYAGAQLRSEELYKQNAAAIQEVLAKKGLALSADDVKGVERVYRAFFTRGMDIHYEVTPGSFGAFPSFAEVMIATDTQSVPRGFLASEESFAFVKDLHRRNLIVPVVGNFAGPKAIRAVGKYLRSNNAVVAAFYVSNVEQYLIREVGLEQFCANASSLPLDSTSVFIRSERGGFGTRGAPPGVRFSSKLHNMQDDLKGCAAQR
jgi:hypothetical protein